MNKTMKLILKKPLISSLCIIIVAVAITFIPLSPFINGIYGEQAAELIQNY